jgi:hypothetical protein
LLAAEIGAGFVFAERFYSATGPVRYIIPASLRRVLPGKRVLLVDDAVNAGSALRATLADLWDCGADLAGFGSLLTLGETAVQIAEQQHVPFFTLVSLQRGIAVARRAASTKQLQGMPLSLLIGHIITGREICSPWKMKGISVSRFVVEEVIERPPYPDVEHQSRRAYIFAGR